MINMCIRRQSQYRYNFKYIQNGCYSHLVEDEEGCYSGQLDKTKELGTGQDWGPFPLAKWNVDLTDLL
jgi:hypothetical protein